MSSDLLLPLQLSQPHIKHQLSYIVYISLTADAFVAAISLVGTSSCTRDTGTGVTRAGIWHQGKKADVNPQ
jgi:hypothetical protein